jgi:hypothetical protein
MPDFVRLLAWGTLMLLLGLGMVHAEPPGQLLGYVFGVPALCLLGGAVDCVVAGTRRDPGWRWRMAGGVLGLAVVTAFFWPAPAPDPHSIGFVPFEALLPMLVAWGGLNAPLSLAAAPRSGAAAIILGSAQALTALLAALPLIDAARSDDSLNAVLDVTINVQGVVLLAGGAAVVALATCHQWRRVPASSGG